MWQKIRSFFSRSILFKKGYDIGYQMGLKAGSSSISSGDRPYALSDAELWEKEDKEKNYW